MASAVEVQRAFVQACLVDREALGAAQARNDAIAALAALKQAFTTDVSPILARVRLDAGGAIDPVGVYRASGYRAQAAAARPASPRRGGGIV
jgi:L-rhamnose isomerase/sugar isomerase